MDSASEDATYDEMENFAVSSPVRTIVLRSEVLGLVSAQNLAIGSASGYTICFTDDDCQLEKDYFDKFFYEKKSLDFQFGSGEIIIRDKRLDPSIANTGHWIHEGNRIIPANSLIGPGIIQGANMFFDRYVLEAIGGVRTVGKATSNDVMTGYLASKAGYCGVQMRGLKVYHEHERLAGSEDAEKIVQKYMRTSGAFFAHLIFRAEKRAMTLWNLSTQNIDVKSMQIQLEGAAEELKQLMQSDLAKPFRHS